MLLFIIAIIAIIAGFVGSAVMTTLARENNRNSDIPIKPITLPRTAGLALGAILIIVSCMATVPSGYTGILTTFGKIEDRSISAGLNFVAPWQKIVTMDNRVQKVDIDTSTFSADIQQVDVHGSISYCITDQSTAVNLYRTVGVNYYDSIIQPSMLDNIEGVFSLYGAESLITFRDQLSEKVTEATQEDVASYGIRIVKIAIQDIDFTDAFTDAVEAKQVAAQNKLAEETRQQEHTMVEEETAKRAIIAANAEAEQAVIAANADLEVVKIQAEASLYAGEKEAEMNKRISESLTNSLVDYYWIKQWDGKLPSTVLSGDSGYMIDLSK